VTAQAQAAAVLGATQTGVVDKFEPPSEVSNFDRTATIQGAQVPRCQARPARHPVPPDTPAARLKEPKSKVTCVRPRVR
jgi:hypothetical protein